MIVIIIAIVLGFLISICIIIHGIKTELRYREKNAEQCERFEDPYMYWPELPPEELYQHLEDMMGEYRRW